MRRKKVITETIQKTIPKKREEVKEKKSAITICVLKIFFVYLY
jgi:hypothetical protein